MNRRSRIVVALAALTLALAPLAAPAARAVDIVPAKLKVKGVATSAVAGRGRVIVQVLVHPDGSHQAIRVIHSTNRGDNAAAMQIAQSSTYRPATRNGKPTVWFYDYTLVFTGAGVAVNNSSSSNSPLARIQRMIRAGNYPGAEKMAGSYLLSNPGDSAIRTQLAVADYFANNFDGSAAAFSRAGNVDSRYKSVAGHAFTQAAVDLAVSDPATAVGYGQKAVELDPGANSYFGLGVAQLGAKDSLSAVGNLKKARDLAFADKSTDVKSKVNLDTALLQAYAAQNDVAGVKTIGAEITQIDPTSTAPKRILGLQYLNAARTAGQAGDIPTAMTNYDLAIANGDSVVQVTANAEAALALMNGKKPDITKVKAYADQAVALGPNDPVANFAEGAALTQQWASNHNADTKKQALAACLKAEQLATAANNNTLLFQIQSFVKTNLS